MDGVRLPSEVSARYRVSSHLLGEGAYGSVFEARARRRVRRTNRRFRGALAIKRCLGVADAADSEALQRTFREVALLRRLQHKNVIPLLDAAMVGTDVYLIFPRCSFDLGHAARSGALIAAHWPAIVAQILRALSYLHAARVLHRDLKPANVLLDFQRLPGAPMVQLGDFGLARLVGAYPRGLTEYVGMRWYRAPELLLGSRRYAGGVDVWALGCVVGELALGRPLAMGASAQEQLALTLGLLLGRAPLDEEEADLADISPDAITILRSVEVAGRQLESLLVRATSNTDLIDFVRQCLKLSSEERPGACELLQHAFIDGHREDADELNFAELVELPALHSQTRPALEYRYALAEEVAGLRFDLPEQFVGSTDSRRRVHDSYSDSDDGSSIGTSSCDSLSSACSHSQKSIATID